MPKKLQIIMKSQKSDPKKISSKKKLDIDETRKTPKLKPPDKKLNKNWKKSLFIEDEDDFSDDEFFKSDFDENIDEEKEYND